jgi:hypothetical protein
VVAWRPDSTEHGIGIAGVQRGDALNTGSGCQSDCIPTVLIHPCVGVESPTSSRVERRQLLDELS